MDTKNYTQVLIDGKIYTLGGSEDEAYLQKAASYVNEKITTMHALPGFSKQSADYQQLMLLLNIADDYFKAKALVEKLEGDIENKDKEIYDLKHDLISNQVKTENAEASMKELEAQNKELLLNKARLEATLEESLLDGKKPVKKSAHASKGANDSSDK